MKGIRRACAGLLWVLAPSTASAQNAGTSDAATLDPADPPAVVRTAADHDNRVTVPIRIGESGPYAFIVDTGSQRTVISRELADRLALVPDTPVTVLSMTGSSQVDTVTVPRLSFGSTNVSDIQAPVFSGEHLGGEGLLGLDGLHAKRLVLNFRSGRMEVGPTRRTRTKDSDAIVVTARSKLGQLILLDSQAEGQRVHVILDTGSEYSIGNAALLKRLTQKNKKRFMESVSMTSVTGESLLGQWGMISKIKMGSLTMTNLPVVFAEAAPFAELGLSDKPAILLGISALRAFERVSIDFGAKRVDFLLPDQGALAGPQLASLQP